MHETSCDLTVARKTFSRIGLALCAILAIATGVQLLWFLIPVLIWGEENWMTGSSWGFWLGTFLPLYLVAIPVGLVILRKLPAEKPEEHKPKAVNALVILPICFFLMYTGNLIGTFLSMLFSGGTAENAVMEYATDSNPLKVLFMVVLAPLLEEYVCRKQLIDRTRQYGEKTAVLLSGFVFGLLHQNLFQFFYAFSLGALFAYVYIRTGRLRYTVLLHALINFMGAVVAPWILTLVDYDAMAAVDPSAPPEELLALMEKVLPGMLVMGLYGMLLLGLSVAGLVLLIIKRKELVWKESPCQLSKGAAAKAIFGNVGMVLYILVCAAGFVLALL